MYVVKQQLNLGPCKFGLKSYLWFQIEITRMISDRIALH